MAITQTKTLTEDYFSNLAKRNENENRQENNTTPNISGRIKSFSERYRAGFKPGFPKHANHSENNETELENEKSEKIKMKNYAEIKMKIRAIYVNLARQYKAQYGIDIEIPSENLDKMAANVYSKSQNIRGSKTSDISNQKSYNTMIGNECRNMILDYLDKDQNPSKTQKDNLNSDTNKKRKRKLASM